MNMMTKKNSCCFTGHRKISAKDLPYVKARLCEEIFKMIEIGVENFICGGALGFDTLAAQTVLNMRYFFSEITLTLCIPCRDQTSLWNEKSKLLYNEILKRADNVICMSEVYEKGCMQRRNRAMVDASDYCIAFLEKQSGGTFFTVNYAKRKGVKLIFI